MNKELIEENNNFPRFNITCTEDETENDILNRIKSQGKKIINSLTKINPKKNDGTEKENDGVAYSIQDSNKSIRKKRRNSAVSMKKGGEKREESPHLTDSESSEDDDNELNSDRKRNMTIPQGKMEIKEKGLLPSQIANQVRMKRTNLTLSGRKETDLIVL